MREMELMDPPETTGPCRAPGKWAMKVRRVVKTIKGVQREMSDELVPLTNEIGADHSRA